MIDRLFAFLDRHPRLCALGIAVGIAAVGFIEAHPEIGL